MAAVVTATLLTMVVFQCTFNGSFATRCTINTGNILLNLANIGETEETYQGKWSQLRQNSNFPNNQTPVKWRYSIHFRSIQTPSHESSVSPNRFKPAYAPQSTKRPTFSRNSIFSYLFPQFPLERRPNFRQYSYNADSQTLRNNRSHGKTTSLRPDHHPDTHSKQRWQQNRGCTLQSECECNAIYTVRATCLNLTYEYICFVNSIRTSSYNPWSFRFRLGFWYHW